MMGAIRQRLVGIASNEVTAVLQQIARGLPHEVANRDGDCLFRRDGWKILFATEGGELEGVVSVAAPDGRWRGACRLDGLTESDWSALSQTWASL